MDSRNNRYGSEGDLPATHSPIPPADLLIGHPAPSGGQMLGSLSQTFPPCLIGPASSVSPDQPSPSWDSYAPDWDPRSLPQHSQPHRDRAPSLSPLQRVAAQAPAPPQASQPSGFQGAYSHTGSPQGPLITKKPSTTPPSLPPQRGSPMPTSYSAIVQGFHAHTTPDFDPDPEACTSWRDYVRCMPTNKTSVCTSKKCGILVELRLACFALTFTNCPLKSHLWRRKHATLKLNSRKYMSA